MNVSFTGITIINTYIIYNMIIGNIDINYDKLVVYYTVNRLYNKAYRYEYKFSCYLVVRHEQISYLFRFISPKYYGQGKNPTNRLKEKALSVMWELHRGFKVSRWMLSDPFIKFIYIDGYEPSYKGSAKYVEISLDEFKIM